MSKSLLCFLQFLLQIIRSAAGQKWRPRRICLQAPETSAFRIVDGLEDCEVSFNEDHTAIAFPRRLLHLSWCSRSQSKSSDATPDDELTVGERTLAESLRRLLKYRLGNYGLPTLEEAAEMTGMSQRTIRRRLYLEGTTYRKLMDRIRFDSAQEMLVDGGLSVRHIAFELGYSGANNFIRAFRRISGMTPTEFRRISETSVGQDDRL